MRRVILFYILMQLLLVACSGTSDNCLCVRGVSQQLAELRKREIKELSYDLFFSLPCEKDSAVRGNIVISFALDARQDVILDFCASPDKVGTIEVNDAAVTCDIRDEHIIIPSQATVVGKNKVHISFVAGNQSLNRNDDYMYTLLVPDRARTLFPCFEQPNLKALFTLSLELPANWEAVSNSRANSTVVNGDRKTIQFERTEPLSTYLFSFVAGNMQRCERNIGGRVIAAYHRENDPKRLLQLDIIFSQVAASIEWLEHYTGIPYPFAKYDIVILPGFQYGGMEHTGATLYNDATLFLGEHTTPDEELQRALLIAHETAHMWFGDYVTMEWFDEVWTKEVFANYFAAEIVEPLFPHINHELNWLKTNVASALSEERTAGTTAIKQPLDNLNNAGLIYSNIIYCKAPVMMKKLVEIMGEEAFREGIREYLATYAYDNATWDDLVAILDTKCEEDIAGFSDVWVNKKGMPHITLNIDNGTLRVQQSDPLQRGLFWPQSFNVTLVGSDTVDVEVTMDSKEFECDIPNDTHLLLPNSDGRGYALFIPDDNSFSWLLDNWHTVSNETARQSYLMILYENYLAKRVDDAAFADALLQGLHKESNPLIASSICSYLGEPLRNAADSTLETALYNLSQSHKLKSCRIALLRQLVYNARYNSTVESLYSVWASGKHTLLGENDYMSLAYELALRLPERSEQIIAKQRARITNDDRRRQFDFVSRAAVADTLLLDELFASFMLPENRLVEPWTAKALSYLNHPLRATRSLRYIRPALDKLQEVQRTGDIFFPRNWVGALLRDYRSSEAYDIVEKFFADNPDYPYLLKSKILQAAFMLHRANN